MFSFLRPSHVAADAKDFEAADAKDSVTKVDIFNLSNDSISKSHDIISKIINEDISNPMYPTHRDYKDELTNIRKALTDANTQTAIISQNLASKTYLTNINEYDKAIISVISAFRSYLSRYPIPEDKEQEITEAWRHFKIALDFITIGKSNLNSTDLEYRIGKIKSRIKNISERITKSDFQRLRNDPIYVSNEFYRTNKYHNDTFVKSANANGTVDINDIRFKLGGKRRTRVTKPHKKSRKTKKSNNRGVRKTSHRKKK
jgi:hypothetical protein